MSNENSTTNSPLLDKKRYRNFCLMTYLNPTQIGFVLLKHDSNIRAYAYIVHDKDVDENGLLKEVHCHLLLSLVNNTTVNAVRSWFKGFTDVKGMPINTLGQPMHDISSSFEYLTHNTEQARFDGKYIYPETDVVSNNVDFFKDSSISEVDNLTLALDDMFSGIPLIEIYKKYGRDFIVHFGHIKDLYNCIQKQNGGNLI